MKKKMLVRGPSLSQSGYGEQTRFALRALRTQENIYDIFIHNLNWGKTSWIWEDNEERRWIDALILKSAQYFQAGNAAFDISLQITIPNEWQKIAPINIGYTAGIESSRVAPGWLEKSFLMDKIIVPSNHSKQVYEGSRAQKKDDQGNVFELRTKCPVEVINFPFKNVEASEIDLDLEYDFNFLTIAQWSPRKNLANTIKWFVEEFHDQEVGLVIKCSTMNNCLVDSHHTRERLNLILKELDYKNKKCKVYLLHGYLKEHEMAALYQHSKIKALVSLSHGEGFGLPLIEAAGYGMPIITTEWSGPCDFLSMPVIRKNGRKKNKFVASKVDFVIKPIQKEAVWDGVLEKESMWAFPLEESSKLKFREIIKNYDQYNEDALELSDYIKENWTREGQYKKFVDAITPFGAVSDAEVNEIYRKLTAGPTIRI
tara:strand:+ start:94 stop:1377 length:1284 start_codon:yes stop_codon:yes gene_type:complete